MFQLPYTLGDYSLVKLLQANRGRLIYVAEQLTTSRKVLLEMPDEDHRDAASVDAFLKEARLKATVEAPFIPVAYEASQSEGIWHFSYELPEGTSVSELLENQQHIQAKDIINILKTLVKAVTFFREHNLSTLPLTPDLVLLDSSSNVRLLNPVIDDSNVSHDQNRIEDVKLWGELIPRLITPGMRAATRFSTIAQWMREGRQKLPLTWEQVLSFTETVEDQLIQETATTVTEPRPKKKKLETKHKLIAVGVLLVAIVGGWLASPEEQPQLPQVIRPHKPNFSQRDHTLIPITLKNGKKIQCDAHEVTIGAYNNFLKSLDRMPPGTDKTYAHPDQPASKTSFQPSDWDKILSAATNNGTYKGRKLSLRTPVFLVDFWDAYAYAKWKGHRLPSQEEWTEMADHLTIDDAGDPFGPVDQYAKDVAREGICGFNSGVSEWTSTLKKDPATPPSEPKSHIICGGNAHRPGHSADPRFAPTPNLKEDSLGFRTVR